LPNKQTLADTLAEIQVHGRRPLLINRTTRAFAWLSLLLGVATIVASTYIGICGYSPVLFGDEWAMPMDTVIFGGHYPLSKLWEQHNEHRIPFQKALELLGMYWFQADQRFLLVVNWVIQAALCVAGALFLKRAGGLTFPEWLTAVGLLCFCAFNPATMQLFVWGIGPTFLGSIAASFISLSALTVSGLRVREGRPAWGWLVFSLAAALLAESSLASGVLVWAILPVCAILLGSRFRVAAGLAAIGALGIGIYLIGYRTPGNASNPLDAVKNVPQVFAFVDAYFGQTWHDIFPRAGEILAAIALLVILVFPAIAFLPWKKERPPLQVFAWSLGTLMVLTSLVTALGRQNEGISQAREGRYQACAVFFWWAVALLLLTSARNMGRYRAVGLIAVQALFCLVMITNLTAFEDLVQQWSHESYIKNMAGLSVELGVDDLPMIRHIYPAPPVVIPLYRGMTAQGLVKPPFPEYRLIGKPLKEVFTVRASGCQGGIQNISVIANRSLERDITAEGWFEPGPGQPQIRRVFAATDEGWIVGFGVTDQYQWHLAGTVPRLAAKLSVYALLPGGKSICFPPAEKALPKPD